MHAVLFFVVDCSRTP